ncbi:hypothetical protein [Clostridium sp.]|uniref:hypothetical protein n=1 Tax=Clostridium sp. TaxID=1506 RepID=UPI001A4C7179|nr:hypothetical protein [Clostridium sp.]MBK5240004.1 hypothetical protein [Clostridium sp.]
MLNNYKDLTDKIHKKFNVNLTLCKITGQRWSYVYEVGNFIHGNQKIKINDNYGLIIDCDDDTAAQVKISM